MKRSTRSGADAVIGRIEAARSLDNPGYLIGKALARSGQIAGRPSKNLANGLHGAWFGHPLHPMLVTIPIGTWTLALGLDLLGALGILRERSAAPAADLALKAGTAGAVAAAAAGLADWQHTDGRDRRLGLVHAAANSMALALNLVSISCRSQGRLREGRLTSAAAWVCMFAGGYLGGHLVYRRRAGVDHADRSPEPREFQAVLPLAELADKKPRRVDVWDENARQKIGVVLVRQGDRVHAMGARCSHQDGPLDQGWILGGTLVCPWHGSRYDLETGQPTSGPSTCPQPRYAVRLRDGMVEIRREQEPGDNVVTAETLTRAALRERPAADGDTPTGRKADEVLFEHHQLLRRLFERTEATPGNDPRRRELMRMLASELEIHELVEDKIFYPAVQPVSEDVEVAHAEHGQLADLLAMTLKLDLASAEFEEHLRALHAAVDHHAGSEERSMFIEAQRLGDARLRELGHALEVMLEEERTSRFRRAFRELKISLLEGL
ncbi:MAG TPA: DUF2231 domain-containing protein [Roseomonas sp.]|jgi:nitrite reductase/ring-hydroxylating ferredoxin subunit/uncharacterized membrane protein